MVDIIEVFRPLFDTAFKILKEAYQIYQNAKYNKQTCLVLYDRLESGTQALKVLKRHQDENLEKFKDENFYKSFLRYLGIATEIKNLIKEAAEVSGAMKYIRANSLKEKIDTLIKRYDEACGDLNSAISLNNFLSLDYIKKSIESDNIKTKKLLKTIEDGTTRNQESLELLIELVSDMAQKFHKDQSDLNDFTYKKIEASQLTGGETAREKVFKRILNRTQPVACVPYNESDWKENHLRAHLAILSKLYPSNNMIRFHGTSCVDEKNVMVFDWADLGDLKTVYSRFTIPWNYKLKIAHDICNGLVFLHACSIFHHDVRCKNVLIMGPDFTNAKLANFDLSREHKQKSSNEIEFVGEILPWLAPEKLRDYDDCSNVRYTHKCEVYSFGMFLWELAFQEVPYEKRVGRRYAEIKNHVLSGKRENFDYAHGRLPPPDIRFCFEWIIKSAWRQTPSERPNMTDILSRLYDLYSKYFPELNSQDNFLLDLNKPRDSCNIEIENEHFDDLDINEIPMEGKFEPIPSLEEGVKFHRQELKEKAWRCFEYHANLGDDMAKYWKAYYLLEGHAVEKNIEEATRLFKEAADNDISEAQLRYAFILFGKSKEESFDPKEPLSYLIRAAESGNSVAMYHLGDIYLNGKSGETRNEERAYRYFKSSAVKGYEKAIRKLENLHLNLYD